jgi:hypothetical protein
MALLTLAPTLASAGARGGLGKGVLGAAPHGLWQVTLANSRKVAVAADVWIERNDSAPGQRTRRRQSRLADDQYRRHSAKPNSTADSPLQKVMRSGTTSNLASGAFVEAVGGYRLSDRRLAAYSSSGDIGRIEGPVCASPSEEGFGLSGLRVICVNPGDSIRMQGTSLAAPIWARYMVHVLMAGESAPTKQALLAGTTPPSIAPPSTAPIPSPDTGFGYFDPR